MMLDNSSTTITASKLGKAFTIHGKKKAQFKEIFGAKNKQSKQYWALREISFELKKGESIGVIGKNGSGKSTLLQLICGTLTPTEGEVITKGKIAALLELGSGFNPDFTGRENVYLNATLLGLTKKEIENNFDNILSFADIGSFIDQPIKKYSNGMVVRLAFAVMANVNADILIIDEALAVGDAYFTQKCMRFIQRIREEKSLMFVSHDANAVLNLCDKAILLENGSMTRMGKPKQVMEEYTKGLQKEMAINSIIKDTGRDNQVQSTREIKESWTSGSANTYKQKWQDYRTKYINCTELSNKITVKKFDREVLQIEDYGGDLARIQDVTLTNIETENDMNIIMGGELVNLEIIVTTYTCVENPIVGFLLKNDKGVTLLGENSYNKLDKQMIRNINQKTRLRTTFGFTIPLLPSGEYSISASIADGDQKQHKILHWKNDAIVLRSNCSSVAAGVAGVPMHLIRMETI